MSMVIECPHCHVKLKVPDNAQGKQGKCPECQGTVRVPAKPASDE